MVLLYVLMLQVNEKQHRGGDAVSRLSDAGVLLCCCDIDLDKAPVTVLPRALDLSHQFPVTRVTWRLLFVGFECLEHLLGDHDGSQDTTTLVAGVFGAVVCDAKHIRCFFERCP